MSRTQVNVNEERKGKRNTIQKQESFSKLEHLKKKGIVTDYDMELAVYRDAKYNHRK